ncbi:hypothetical protein HHX47_DHR1000935 [Lentinula edodes]|nr:hypothetical protein HHX47_DHR1000935 [Lentinula edodes]
MNYEANRGYFNGYDGYGSGFNFTYAYDSNIGQEGVPQSRNADPYAEEYPTNFTQHPRNYQVDAGSYSLGYSEAGNTNHWHHDTEIHGDTVSRQRPHLRTSSNRNNRSAGRRDRPTIQPEQIPVPSSTYLRLAEQPSVQLTDSTQTRKLLILDLNGTLLYREPRTRDGYDPYALNESRPLRPTHTRPYMTSFKAFLFHPETRKWLDTMVWSSAQYPNVKDMVGRCFGEEEVEGYAEHVESLADGTESHRGGLVALWDRKFLGLSETQYRNKFQTTKNLAKPWALLPLSTFSGPTKMLSEAWDRVENDDVDIVETASKSLGVNSGSRLNNTSFLNSLLEENHLTRNDLLSHSALSTLLLDDSPLKARMQPYNHVCVPEYEGKFYARDVRIAEARDGDAFSDDIAVAVERTETSSSEDIASAGVGKRKRSRSLSPQLLPRNHKKMKRLSPEYDADDLSQQHDHILLAVIGLLEALKYESNVAAWIKDNGLFAPNRTESEYINPTLLEGDPEATRIVEGHDAKLDSLYRSSVPEGANGVALTAKKKKERWRNNRHSGRDSGVSALSLGSESSWTDGSMSFSESVDSGHGNDIGVGDARIKNEDNEIYPSQSQHTEPASRPNTPDSRDTSTYSSATTQPPSPPNARLRRDLARKMHLLPRQERRDVPQHLPPTLNFIDSIYLYGKEDTSDRLKAEPSLKRSNLDCTRHVDHAVESNSGEKDIFSNPRASPPGLTGKGLNVDISVGLETPPVELSVIENAVAQTSKFQIPIQPLPSLWYQHPPARWYWVRRGVRALKELGLEVIPGVETNLD